MLLTPLAWQKDLLMNDNKLSHLEAIYYSLPQRISSGQLGHCDGTGLHNYVRKTALRSQPQFSKRVNLIANSRIITRTENDTDRYFTSLNRAVKNARACFFMLRPTFESSYLLVTGCRCSRRKYPCFKETSKQCQSNTYCCQH